MGNLEKSSYLGVNHHCMGRADTIILYGQSIHPGDCKQPGVILKSSAMKSIRMGLYAFLFCLLLISCGKTGRDVYTNTDKVDGLFGQLKYDTTYRAYHGLLLQSTAIIVNNSKKSGKSDTAVLNRKDISLEEKYKILNYSGYDEMVAISKKQVELLTILNARYPEFKTLTDEEVRKLNALTNKYFRKKLQ